MTPVPPVEELYRTAPVGLVMTAADGTVLESNDTMLDWLRTSRENFVGSKLQDHLETGSRMFYETRHAAVLALQGSVREVSLVMLAAGSSLPVLLNASVQPDGLVQLAVFDASARSEYERELLGARRIAETSEVRVRVLQSASNAFGGATTEQEVFDALLDSAREAFSATATGVFRLDDGEFVLMAGEHPLDGLLPRSAPRASDEALLEERTITISVRDADTPYTALVAGLRERRLDAVTVVPLLRNGIAIGVLACFFAREQEFDLPFTDLQAALSRQASQAIVRVRLQKELQRLALHDQLTGLANRKLILETVSDSIERAMLSGQPLAVLFLDLDGFKGINDQLGHAAGDAVLVQVGERIRAGVRHDDTVGRYGGDEFVVVCEDADREAAAAIADRVREAVARPLAGIDGHTVSASVGVADYRPGVGPEPSNDELLSLADSAMYLAKSAGKDRVAFLRH